MTKDELVTKQQLQIEDLEKELEYTNGILEQAARMFICIGAPLNDNILEFNNQQLTWANEVHNIIIS